MLLLNVHRILRTLFLGTSDMRQKHKLYLNTFRNYVSLKVSLKAHFASFSGSWSQSVCDKFANLNDVMVKRPLCAQSSHENQTLQSPTDMISQCVGMPHKELLYPNKLCSDSLSGHEPENTLLYSRNPPGGHIKPSCHAQQSSSTTSQVQGTNTGRNYKKSP